MSRVPLSLYFSVKDRPCSSKLLIFLGSSLYLRVGLGSCVCVHVWVCGSLFLCFVLH